MIPRPAYLSLMREKGLVPWQLSPRIHTNEARMNTNKCCEDNGLRGICVPAQPVSGNSWFLFLHELARMKHE